MSLQSEVCWQLGTVDRQQRTGGFGVDERTSSVSTLARGSAPPAVKKARKQAAALKPDRLLRPPPVDHAAVAEREAIPQEVQAASVLEVSQAGSVALGANEDVAPGMLGQCGLGAVEDIAAQLEMQADMGHGLVATFEKEQDEAMENVDEDGLPELTSEISLGIEPRDETPEEVSIESRPPVPRFTLPKPKYAPVRKPPLTPAVNTETSIEDELPQEASANLAFARAVLAEAAISMSEVPRRDSKLHQWSSFHMEGRVCSKSWLCVHKGISKLCVFHDESYLWQQEDIEVVRRTWCSMCIDSAGPPAWSQFVQNNTIFTKYA
eukprot:4944839-Amphidinium_carterae.1